jgi:hypothetical protein
MEARVHPGTAHDRENIPPVRPAPSRLASRRKPSPFRASTQVNPNTRTAHTHRGTATRVGGYTHTTPSYTDVDFVVRCSPLSHGAWGKIPI